MTEHAKEEEEEVVVPEPWWTAHLTGEAIDTLLDTSAQPRFALLLRAHAHTRLQSADGLPWVWLGPMFATQCERAAFLQRYEADAAAAGQAVAPLECITTGVWQILGRDDMYDEEHRATVLARLGAKYERLMSVHYADAARVAMGEHSQLPSVHTLASHLRVLASMHRLAQSSTASEADPRVELEVAMAVAQACLFQDAAAVADSAPGDGDASPAAAVEATHDEETAAWFFPAPSLELPDGVRSPVDSWPAAQRAAQSYALVATIPDWDAWQADMRASLAALHGALAPLRAAGVAVPTILPAQELVGRLAMALQAAASPDDTADKWPMLPAEVRAWVRALFRALTKEPEVKAAWTRHGVPQGAWPAWRTPPEPLIMVLQPFGADVFAASTALAGSGTTTALPPAAQGGGRRSKWVDAQVGTLRGTSWLLRYAHMDVASMGTMVPLVPQLDGLTPLVHRAATQNGLASAHRMASGRGR